MKNKFYYILFLFSALSVAGQVTLEVSEVKDTRINQKFNLTVLLEISGENMVQETPLRMPDMSKFDIVGSASEQNTVVLDPKKGDVLNQLIYQYVLSPKQSGKIKFGSVLVTVNGKIYKTEPFEINVRDSEKASAPNDYAINDDVYLNMEVQDRSIYKHQPTVAILRAYSRNYGSLRKVQDIRYPKQKNIRIEPVHFAKAEIETRSGLASQVLAVFLIFPSESGSIDISPVSASLSNAKSEKLSSNKVRLHVKKLPAGMPAFYKNAVGNFDISVAKRDPAEKTEIDKPLNVTVKVSGSGNFRSLNLPKMVPSENYTFFKPKVTPNTSPDKEGLEGSITADYVVIPKKAGPVAIQFEQFSYFNPTEQKYVDLGMHELLIDVQTHEQIVDAKSALERVNDYTNNVLETVNTPVLQTQHLKIKNKEVIDWKIVFGNLALLGVLISAFFVARKKIDRHRAKPIAVGKPIITIAETEEILRKKMSVQFDDNIEYLKNRFKNKDFTKFFTAYDELHAETKKSLKVANDTDFRKYLEQHFGQIVAEDYRILSEQIKIEKYAPYHSEETMEKLLGSIIKLYSEIRL